MPRCKDNEWNVDSCPQSGKAATALLMDLRDELKKLNRVFECHNFVAMPREIARLRKTVDRLERRIARKVPLRKR